MITVIKRSADYHGDVLLRPVTSQQVTRHTRRCWRGQSGSKVTKVPIDENKIRRGGRAVWGGGWGRGGSREMRVFVFKEEIGWPGIFLAWAITVVSVAVIALKYKGPL